MVLAGINSFADTASPPQHQLVRLVDLIGAVDPALLAAFCRLRSGQGEPMSENARVDRLEILKARDECGRRVWLLDAVLVGRTGVFRGIVSDHYFFAEAMSAALEWQARGFRVVWPKVRG